MMGWEVPEIRSGSLSHADVHGAGSLGTMGPPLPEEGSLSCVHLGV